MINELILGGESSTSVEASSRGAFLPNRQMQTLNEYIILKIFDKYLYKTNKLEIKQTIEEDSEPQ